MNFKSDFFNKFNMGTTDFVTPGKQLEYVSMHKPDEKAIIYIDKEQRVSDITWRQLHIYSNQLAWLLLEKGIGKGSVVLVALPNCIEHFIAAFALWKTGACYLPVSSKAARSEMSDICRIIKPEAAFSDIEIPDTEIPEAKIVLDSENMYEALGGQPQEMPEDVAANPNMISMSGGTSGKLKFIRQNMPCGLSDNIIKNWFKMSGMDFEQRQLLLGPLFHGAPHTAAFNGLFVGNTLVVPRNLCPYNIVELIREYRIEFMQMVPTLMNRIIKLPDIKKEDFASVKTLCHTGGYCSDYLKQRWIDMLAPEKVYEMYSMTEVIGLTCIRGDEWLKHRGSVGLPAGEGKVSIRDKDGNELPPHQIGEIYMTSPSASFATDYINQNPLEIKNGGFRSVGDIGYVDEDGYLYFSDRRSDMLVTGGENVFATEVEAALMCHPWVMDAVVIGIPDEEWGRKLHAVVETGAEITEGEMREFLKGHLSPYKIPKTFEFVRYIKRKDNGKADREELLRECIERMS